MGGGGGRGGGRGKRAYGLEVNGSKSMARSQWLEVNGSTSRSWEWRKAKRPWEGGREGGREEAISHLPLTF